MAKKQLTYLIWSNEHNAWWKPNKLGYTEDIRAAGFYEYEQALDICLMANWMFKPYLDTNDTLPKTKPNEVMVPVYI